MSSRKSSKEVNETIESVIEEWAKSKGINERLSIRARVVILFKKQKNRRMEILQKMFSLSTQETEGSESIRRVFFSRSSAFFSGGPDIIKEFIVEKRRDLEQKGFKNPYAIH